MNARETIQKWLREAIDLDDINRDDDDLASQFFAALKAEGLFVGPLRSTADMDLASPLDPQLSSDTWDAMVEEWQRTEGA